MRNNVEYTKHFGERFLERVDAEDHVPTLRKIKGTVNDRQCQLIYECCINHRGQSKVKAGKYVATVRFQKDSMKLYVTTIYKKG